jgi:hypothetical protein
VIESLKGEMDVRLHITESLCSPPWMRDAKVVRVCGTVESRQTNSKAGIKTNYFDWVIEVNSIVFADDSTTEPPTQEEVKKFDEWVKNHCDFKTFTNG